MNETDKGTDEGTEGGEEVRRDGRTKGNKRTDSIYFFQNREKREENQILST